jgi:hypothetical protein
MIAQPKRGQRTYHDELRSSDRSSAVKLSFRVCRYTNLPAGRGIITEVLYER